MKKSFSSNKFLGNDGLTRVLRNSLGIAKTTFHEFVKPSKSEPKIGHIPKASK